MIKRIVVLAAAALVAAGGLAGPAAAANDKPSLCIYKNSYKIKRPMLVQLVKSGFQTRTSDEQAAFLTLGRIVTACQAQYGWGDKRRNLALRVMSGRVLLEDAAYHGKAVGLTEEMISGYVASLDPAGRAVYTGGSIGPDQHRAAFEHLRKSGMALDTMSPDDIRRVAELMAEGTSGAIMMEDADAAYGR